MSNPFAAFCEDFYVNMRLGSQLTLPHNRETVLHSLATFAQLASIEGSTLRAPEGELDDRAVAYALGCTACRMRTLLYIEGDILCNATLDPDRYSLLDDRLIIGDLEIDFSDNERDDGSAWWRR